MDDFTILCEPKESVLFLWYKGIDREVMHRVVAGVKAQVGPEGNVKVEHIEQLIFCEYDLVNTWLVNCFLIIN